MINSTEGREMSLDKKILEQYIDACELIEETKAEIRKLKKHMFHIICQFGLVHMHLAF